MAETALKVVYWIGAHKTGTNFLQNAMTRSRDHLFELGIEYLGRWDFRSRYTDPLLHPSPKRILAPPPAIAEGTNTVVFFDENLLGTCGSALHGGKLYSKAVQRLRAVSDHLGLSPGVIILGVRAQDSFIRSAYGEALLNGRLATFDRYLRDGASAAHGLIRFGAVLRRTFGRREITPGRLKHLQWSELVGRLSEEFRPQEVVVYRNEQLRGNEARLLSHLFGIDPGRLVLSQEALRPSVFSQRAIREVEKLAATLSSRPRVREVQKILNAVIESYPSGEKWPPFNPWSKHDSAALRRQYANDLASMARIDNVRLLDLTAI